METLLKQYLNNHFNWKTVNIRDYNINGAECFIIYAKDSGTWNTEEITINIWDVLLFVNNKIK
jgi:hypothetical protein